MERHPACRPRRFFQSLLFLLLAVSAVAQTPTPEPNRQPRLELSRPARPWEFMDAVGMRAGLFGNEGGRFEAWVYPLKIMRNFHLVFHVEGRAVSAESLARTVEIRPESSTIIYAGDAFQVRETWFVPQHEMGAVILVQSDSHVPVNIEAVFERDMQLMWPAGLGGTYGDWDKALNAFVFGEEQKKYFAIVGSPDSAMTAQDYVTNYSESSQSSLRLGEAVKGNATKVVAIAGSVKSRAEAEATYRRLIDNHEQLRKETAEHYREYLARTVSLEIPDAELQKAYDWSRISTVQGMVENPFLGTGLIAGYRTSGDTARPGFAWFFGRDALWTALALDSAGDFTDVRTALDFLSKYQRQDGKVPHEISQSASLVPWFKNYPYPWASADATPLFIIAMNDYVRASGDTAFVREKWDNLWRAYEFLRSTYGPEGFAQNRGVGHGWVEGGPLLPVRTELYQSGLGVAALRALSNLARLNGKGDVAADLEAQYAKQRTELNQIFWVAGKGRFAFALNEQGNVVDIPSVLATVPMWFGVLDQDKAATMIDELAGPDHATDWGMRIISERNPVFDPSGYHFGSVWPLFTGWASVGEYAVHRANAGFANLRANSQLALAGAPGRVMEVLSGSYFEPLSTSSPHQIWSAAMVMSGMLRGLLGLSVDATTNTVRLAPHVPAEWDSMVVRNVRVGQTVLTLQYRRAGEAIELEVRQDGAGPVEIEFAPAISVRAQVLGADVNGMQLKADQERTGQDKHIVLRFKSREGVTRARVRVRNDFGLVVPASLPSLGAKSENLKLVAERWSERGDELVLDVAGLAGREYEIELVGGAQVASLEGGELKTRDDGKWSLRVRFSGPPNGRYVAGRVTLHFRSEKRPTRSRLKIVPSTGGAGATRESVFIPEVRNAGAP